MTPSNIAFLSQLETIVHDRIAQPSRESYTSRLVTAGTQRIAQKVGEEGVELALAAMAGDREEIIEEAADLMYHLTVLLAERSISLADVVARLEARHSRT